jgi:hypothetical protein
MVSGSIGAWLLCVGLCINSHVAILEAKQLGQTNTNYRINYSLDTLMHASCSVPKVVFRHIGSGCIYIAKRLVVKCPYLCIPDLRIASLSLDMWLASLPSTYALFVATLHASCFLPASGFLHTSCFPHMPFTSVSVAIWPELPQAACQAHGLEAWPSCAQMCRRGGCHYLQKVVSPTSSSGCTGMLGPPLSV